MNVFDTLLFKLQTKILRSRKADTCNATPLAEKDRHRMIHERALTVTKLIKLFSLFILLRFYVPNSPLRPFILRAFAASGKQWL